jgi:hypothetical protein
VRVSGEVVAAEDRLVELMVENKRQRHVEARVVARSAETEIEIMSSEYNGCLITVVT